MLKKIEKISYSKIIYIVIIILLFISICDLSMLYATFPFFSSFVLGKIRVLIRMFLIFLSFSYYIGKKIEVKKLLFLITYVFIVMLEYIMAKRWLMFDMFFITIFFSKLLDYEKVIKIFFYMLIIGTMLIILLYNLNFFKYYVFYNGRNNNIIRPHFGFGHPNRIGKALLAIVFLYLLMRKRKINLINVIVVLIIAFFIYVFPNSLSSSCTILSVLFVVLVLQNFKINRKFFMCLVCIVFFIMIALTFYFTLNDNGMEIASKLPNTFSSRFRLGIQGINEYGIHPFGIRGIETVNEVITDLFDSEKKYFVLDNLILNILVFSGVIPLIIYICVYIICIYKNFINHNYILLAIIFSLIFYNVTEAGITDFIFNFIFICSVCNIKSKFNTNNMVVN